MWNSKRELHRRSMLQVRLRSLVSQHNSDTSTYLNMHVSIDFANCYKENIRKEVYPWVAYIVKNVVKW